VAVYGSALAGVGVGHSGGGSSYSM
jgi:hypothetical protein